jgi:hypothetical protein
MNAQTRQYIFGAIFIAVGIYYATIQDYLELSLYGVGGLAFIVNALSLEPRFAHRKKVLGIISWVLIITTGLLLIYLIQFKI